MATQSRSGPRALALRVRYLLDVDRPDEALPAALEATRHHPEAAALHFLHGLALERAGRPIEAERAFARACAPSAECDAGHAPSWYHRALLALDTGDREAASAHFEIAARACAGLDEDRPWPEWENLTPGELKRLVVLHLKVDKRSDMGDVTHLEGNEAPARPGAHAGIPGLVRRV